MISWRIVILDINLDVKFSTTPLDFLMYKIKPYKTFTGVEQV